jgi:hypothetical protein
MRYVLNSAVISRPGNYEYRLLTELEAEAWLKQGRFVSRVVSREVAQFLDCRFNIHCPLSRDPIVMQPGDEALVVRLLYRAPAPAAKDPRTDGWEMGLLKRTA